jgi:hypothetical protein
VTADYAYEAPPLATVLQAVAPSFRCSGTNVDGAALQITYVPAAVDAVLPPKQSPPTQPRPDSDLARLTATTTTTAADAGGDIDVGNEGTGECSDLQHTDENLESFNDEFDDHGVPVRFSFLDAAAWETDFKDPSLGGADTTWTDDVDLAYWQGHGSATGFYFTNCSNHNDNKLSHTDARWGNGDAEWMSLFTCLVLDGVAGDSPWWERWGPAFRRLHQVNSYDTVANHSAVHGGIYADYMLDGGTGSASPGPWRPSTPSPETRSGRAWARARPAATSTSMTTSTAGDQSARTFTRRTSPPTGTCAAPADWPDTGVTRSGAP